MRLGGKGLRALDDKVVPRLALGLRRLLRAVPGSGSSASRSAPAASRPATRPAPSSPRPAAPVDAPRPVPVLPPAAAATTEGAAAAPAGPTSPAPPAPQPTVPLPATARHAAPPPAPVAAPVATTSATTDGAPPSTPAPARTSRSPLGVLRDVPQLGLLVAAVVLVGGGGAVLLSRTLGGSDPVDTAQTSVTTPGGAPAPSGSAEPAAGGEVVAGPAAGTPVDQYVSATRDRTAALGRDQPDAPVVALVSLSAHETPEQVGKVVAGLRAGKAFLRAQLPAGDVPELLTAPLSNPTADLKALCSATATRRSDERTTIANALKTTLSQDQKQRFTGLLRVATGEAKAYSGACPTVVAVVVEGPAAAVAALLGNPAVRTVEPAARSTTAESLTVNLLLPEQTGTVTALPTPGP